MNAPTPESAARGEAGMRSRIGKSKEEVGRRSRIGEAKSPTPKVRQGARKVSLEASRRLDRKGRKEGGENASP